MTALATATGVLDWISLGAEDGVATGGARAGGGARVGGARVGGGNVATLAGNTGRESTTSSVPSRGGVGDVATLAGSTGRESTASGVASRGRVGDGELQAPSSTMLTMSETMLPVLTAAMGVLGTSQGSDRRRHDPIRRPRVQHPATPWGLLAAILLVALMVRVLVRPHRAAVIALVAAVAVGICVLTIMWTAADLAVAFARYRGSP